MKKLYVVGKAVLGLALVLSFSSCSTPTTSTIADNVPHFHDDGSVNAVLQFSSWDYTFLIRPKYLDHGYLEQVNRGNLGKVLNQMNVQRGTAVVVVGWTYNGPQLEHLVSDWKNILGGCGFQRVVVLRAQWDPAKLDGSVIVDDSTLHVGSIESSAPRS
ncbi:MAG TPA: hypothetical protein VN873_17305 [Candidatus Angelobacter sp.]|nr:hypothetical protein [Candidatus Angelobacter sp.]